MKAEGGRREGGRLRNRERATPSVLRPRLPPSASTVRPAAPGRPSARQSPATCRRRRGRHRLRRCGRGIRPWRRIDPRAGNARRRRDHRSGLHAAAKTLGTLAQLLRRREDLRLEPIVEHPLVANLARHQVLGNEIQPVELVPRRRNGLKHGQRLITVFDQANLPLTVVGERRRDRRDADLVVVHVDQRPGRIAANGHLPLDAAAGAGQPPRWRPASQSQRPGRCEAWRKRRAKRWMKAGEV